MGLLSGRLWILKAFAIFLVALGGWVVLAIWTGTSYGAELTFAQDLRSRLIANYGEDLPGQGMKYLSLSIIGEVFSDQGITDDPLIIVDSIFDDPVPTATSEGASTDPTVTPDVKPSTTPDLTATAIIMETDSSLLVTTISETPTSTLTETATGTPTPTPTATKTLVPTKTPYPSKTPTSTGFVNDDVYPILECVKYIAGGKFEAFFGYENPGTQTLQIPIGTRNHFEPEPKDRGQPTTFYPGRTGEPPNHPFSVMFEENSEIVWHLTSYAVEASSSSPDCGTIIPTPTYTATPQDTTPPDVLWGYLDPVPGPLTGCSETIHIDELQVIDPPSSSGIDWVKLKYVVHNFTSEIYSDPLALVDGGATAEGGWDGYYSGSITVTIDPEWVIPANDFFLVEFYGKAKDNVSKYGTMYLGTYSMPGSCGTAP